MQKTRTLLKLRTARKCQKRVFWTYHMLYACTVLVITYSVYSVLLQALALAPTACQYITRQASCTSFTPDVSCPNSLLLFSHVALMRRVHACTITFCTHQVLYPPHEYDRLLRKRNHHNKAHHWKCSWLFQSTKRTSIPKLRQRERPYFPGMPRDCGARKRVCVLVDRQAARLFYPIFPKADITISVFAAHKSEKLENNLTTIVR